MQKYYLIISFFSLCFGIDQVAKDLGFTASKLSGADENIVTIDTKVTTNVDALNTNYYCQQLNITEKGHLHITNTDGFACAKAVFHASEEMVINGSLTAEPNISVELISTSCKLTKAHVDANFLTFSSNQIQLKSSHVLSYKLLLGSETCESISFCKNSAIHIQGKFSLTTFIADDIKAHGTITTHNEDVLFYVKKSIDITGLKVDTRLNSENDCAGEFSIDMDAQASIDWQRFLSRHASSASAASGSGQSASFLGQCKISVESILHLIQTTNLTISSDKSVTVHRKINNPVGDSLFKLSIDAPIININAEVSGMQICLMNFKAPTIAGEVNFGYIEEDEVTKRLNPSNLWLSNVNLNAILDLANAKNLYTENSSLHLFSLGCLNYVENTDSLIKAEHLTKKRLLDVYILNNAIQENDYLLMFAKVLKLNKVNSSIKLYLSQTTKLELTDSEIPIATVGVLNIIHIVNSSITSIDYIPKGFKLSSYFIDSYSSSKAYLPALSVIFNNFSSEQVYDMTCHVQFDKVLLKNSKVNFAGGIDARKIKLVGDSTIEGDYPRQAII